jgi:hypothetical protein
MIPAVPDMGSYVLTRYGFDQHRRENKNEMDNYHGDSHQVTRLVS